MTDVAPHDLAGLPELLRARGLRHELRFLGETGSTNDDAKRAAKLGAPHGVVFLAEVQREGRGRHGRAWRSARGEGLLFSVIVRSSGPSSRAPLIALVAGLAVRDAVARALPDREVMIKWPNDVLVGGKKIAGVLVESADGALVVGVGLNVHTRALPPELAARATSVALEGGAPDRAALLCDVLQGLDRDAGEVLARGLGPVHARLTASDALLGRQVELEDGRRGVGAGIDADGRLLVRVEGEVVPLVSGEVSELRWRSRP